jgi:hypothetical protein
VLTLIANLQHHRCPPRCLDPAREGPAHNERLLGKVARRLAAAPTTWDEEMGNVSLWALRSHGDDPATRFMAGARRGQATSGRAARPSRAKLVSAEANAASMGSPVMSSR